MKIRENLSQKGGFIMEDLNEIFRLCEELGITKIGQLKSIRQPNKNVVECLKEIRNKRNNFIYEYKMAKILKSMDYFQCEICGVLTPRKFEGAEPNTCEDCMPRFLHENCGKNQRNDF
jgi:hypothetical protein